MSARLLSAICIWLYRIAREIAWYPERSIFAAAHAKIGARDWAGARTEINKLSDLLGADWTEVVRIRARVDFLSRADAMRGCEGEPC
jgi:hypothetical protein